MPRSLEQLKSDAIEIFQAGLAAVRADRLVENAVRVSGNQLWMGDEAFDLASIRRIVVLGGGKAGAGMARGLLRALPDEVQERTQLHGWLNVPANCATDLPRIHLHAGRPAGVNEPTAEGIAGTAEILRLASECHPDDLCIVLLSGGGSALLPAPVTGVTLAEKQRLTRALSAAGANIEELNMVRRQISRIKGGGLARTCSARRLRMLVISDVLGDPLDVIASGPTVVSSTTPGDALAVLNKFGLANEAEFSGVLQHLRGANVSHAPLRCDVQNLVIGNNATAVDAAGLKAETLGYSHAMICARQSEGPAEEVGMHLARLARQMATQRGPDCLISGGEPVVKLPEETLRGRGGRNQQLALSVLDAWQNSGVCAAVVLSCGTDGEDGPTDAAGAIASPDLLSLAEQQQRSVGDALARCDAYTFFDALGGLVRTGPTDTNVCDLRIVLVAREELA
jgi:hydroxypyruvate reductase